MKVKSITNEKKFLEEKKIYTVYGISVYQENICYCICDKGFTFYPRWRFYNLFEIVDNRLSRYWIFSIDEDHDRKVPFLGFPEWTNDLNFYEDLVDGNSNDPNAIVFRKYKELMDLEFPDSSISEIAQIGDSEWLICPKCIDSWQTKNDRDALVKCPKCRTILNNPRYKDEWPDRKCSSLPTKGKSEHLL